MKTSLAGAALVFAPVAAAFAVPPAAGAYLEARNCDVWTGPCFSNSELGLRGNRAIAAWRVDEGGWDGVALDGLAVAAVFEAEGTLHTAAEGAVRAVLYIDRRASAAQETALAALARALAPARLANVVRQERAAIALERRGLEASLTIGDAARVRTADFAAADSICCHEEPAYPALSGSADVVCAKALEHTYQGGALGDSRWKDPNKRSAMLGRFAVAPSTTP